MKRNLLRTGQNRCRDILSHVKDRPKNCLFGKVRTGYRSRHVLYISGLTFKNKRILL